jgi:hypothetical protein
MATPSLQPTPVHTWKRLAVISLSAGAGFALMLSLIVGGIVWYTSRPKPLKPWDTNAIIAKEAPSFSVSDDGSKIEFQYTLENTTSSDYRINSDSAIKVLLRTKTGTLSPDLSKWALALAVFPSVMLMNPTLNFMSGFGVTLKTTWFERTGL